MIYWLNRRVEKAIEAYLTTLVPSSIKVYRSSDRSARQFPCAVVRAHTNRRFVGEVHACNRMAVTVAVLAEFSAVVDGYAKVLEDFEATQERAVSAVLNALYVEDLATQLTAMAIPGVSISYAAPGSEDGVTSQSAEADAAEVVEIPLVIMAGATEE